MHDIPIKVLKDFLGTQKLTGVEQLSSGLINATYSVSTDETNLVFQTVNTNIFRNPDSISRNIITINSHLKRKRYPLKLLTPVFTSSGDILSIEGNKVWRAFEKIEGGRTFSKVRLADQAYQSSKAIGLFIKSLSDVQTDEITPGIPDFLDFEGRFEAFERAVSGGNMDRISKCIEQVIFLKGQLPYWRDFVKRVSSLPTRIIHGDAKIANVLFDMDGRAPIAVLDLDTLMPGPVFHDLSDMVRSYTNRYEEDDSHPGKDQLDTSVLLSTLEGFKVGVGDILTIEEEKSLMEGIPFVTFIQSLRFLTDYLLGDIYYKVDRPDHNLDRAVNQISLYQLLTEIKLPQYYHR